MTELFTPRGNCVGCGVPTTIKHDPTGTGLEPVDHTGSLVFMCIGCAAAEGLIH